MFSDFTDKAGNLRRKKREHLTNENILSCFIQHAGGSKPYASSDRVVATYTYTCQDEDAGHAHLAPSHFKRPTHNKTVVEHLTESQLNHFLMHREKVTDGQLQRFIAPAHGANATYIATWSPHALLLEKWVNAATVSAHGSSVYAKTVTHEAEPFSAVMEPIKGERYPKEVQRICRSIVEHTAAVSLRRICITRLALTFKLDGAGRLWLAACTSLRFTSSSGSLPHTINEDEAEPLADESAGGTPQEGGHLRSSPSSRVRSSPRLSSFSTSRLTSSPSPSRHSQPSRPQSASSLSSKFGQSQPSRPQSATSLSSKLGSKTPIDLAHKFSPPPGINPMLHAKWIDPATCVEESAVCASCGKAYVESTSVKLPYRILIGSHRRDAGFLPVVPKLIAEKHPSLAYHQFEKLVRSRDPGFLARTVSVCSACWVAHVAKGAASMHSDGRPRASSMASLIEEQRKQRASGATKRLALWNQSTGPAHRQAPQRSATAPALNASSSSGALGGRPSAPKSVTGNSSWAARDLLYLIGHENRQNDRQGSEFIVSAFAPLPPPSLVLITRLLTITGTSNSGMGSN